MQEKGRDEEKWNLSENISEERNANEEKWRDEVKRNGKCWIPIYKKIFTFV